ncbi:PHP domain-containing protein [Candidatus Woesearchaeota archaeon]|nr:PHP domain-containing protein [Candidatus Woesearchaeota archaeon]
MARFLHKMRRRRIKADFHLHSHEDPEDAHMISYSARDLVDALAEQGFSAFSLTLHDHMLDDDEMSGLESYAKERGLISIPGIEKTIEGSHVLIYNMKKEDAESISTFPDLESMIGRYKESEKASSLFVVAAHPFFPFFKYAIGKDYDKWRHLFDGLEYSSLYPSMPFNKDLLNFNLRAAWEAKMHKKVMIGGTDCHMLDQLGKTYTWVMVSRKQYKVLKGRYREKEQGFRGNLSLQEKPEERPGGLQGPQEASYKNFFQRYVSKASPSEYARLRYVLVRQMKRGNVKVRTKARNPITYFATLAYFIFMDSTPARWLNRLTSPSR